MSNRRLNFSQVISMYTDHAEEIICLLEEWDELQSTLDVMGYTGTHVLVDRDDPRHLMIVAEFASVEPGVSAWDEAQKNNDRPQTNEWAARMRELIDGEPEWLNFDEVYRTDAV
ncbi:MAG: hypothetical protein ABWY80_02240 [Acidimicrobiia bacterium]